MEKICKISIVSPVYHASGNINELIERINEGVGKVTPDFEIVLVEDGSKDRSWEEIQMNCRKHAHVKGIKLSRNFGQHYAVTAGLEFAKGDCIMIMDCDLQDDPSSFPELYRAFCSGNEIVFTKRLKRSQPFFKSISGKIFNLLFKVFSDQNYDVDTGSMVLFSARVKNIFLQFKDKDRLYIQLLKWIGFKYTYISIEHKPRFAGRSSYNFYKLVNLAFQGWTSHSDKLLRLSIYTGFALSLITVLIAIYIIILYFVKGFQPGWPSLFVAILFSTGLILLSIGVTGIYIAKIFEQSKNRPLYIVDEKLNVS